MVIEGHERAKEDKMKKKMLPDIERPKPPKCITPMSTASPPCLQRCFTQLGSSVSGASSSSPLAEPTSNAEPSYTQGHIEAASPASHDTKAMTRGQLRLHRPRNPQVLCPPRGHSHHNPSRPFSSGFSTSDFDSVEAAERAEEEKSPMKSTLQLSVRIRSPFPSHLFALPCVPTLLLT
ncbi:hypothetical protein BDN67DRAFT_282472 [Paxillus ammoniavirescens]|nr:hypothetical protein BDN67DRAFT_282472 [Paxillus ammoniavirescens]